MSVLGEYAEFEMGQAPPGNLCNTDGTGTVFVKAGEFGSMYPAQREWTTKPLKYGRGGDVFICVVGATAGKLNLGIDCAIGRSVAAIRPKRGLNTKFLYYQLQPWVLKLRAASAGSAQGVINKKQLAEIPLEVPNLEKQHLVVSEIEKQFSRLDEAVANLKRIKANLRRYRAATLKAAADGAILSALNVQAWRRATIGDVARVIGGLTKNPKRASLPTKLPYLRVANVYANELRLADIEHIGVAEGEVERLLVRRGDLLVVEGNGSLDQIGRVALWDDSIPNCVHQNHLIKVRFNELVMPQWGLTWLLSPGGRHEIEQVSASTSGLHTLSTGKVARLPIPVPPSDVQRRIIAEVDRRLSIVREIEAEVDANHKRAQSLRQSILAKAFSGAAA